MLSPEVLRPTEHCTVGCALLDGLLRGGVAAASLTELTGESTAGKTQLCLQLLLAVQLPVSEGGLGGRAVYIHTEGRAQLGRLAAIARARFPQLPSPCDLVLVANASAGPEQLVDAVKQARGWHRALPRPVPAHAHASTDGGALRGRRPLAACAARYRGLPHVSVS
jgi:DNA-repair protein XRCC3